MSVAVHSGCTQWRVVALPRPSGVPRTSTLQRDLELLALQHFPAASPALPCTSDIELMWIRGLHSALADISCQAYCCAAQHISSLDVRRRSRCARAFPQTEAPV